MIAKICLFCKKKFKTRPDRGIFCSLKCRGLADRKRVKRTCSKCGKKFEVAISTVKFSGAKYCSKKCQNIEHPYMQKEKHWFWGKQRSEKTRNKISKAKFGKYRDEQSPQWKGDKVGIGGLHSWVKRKLGRPKKCEHCGTTKAPRFHWANKSGKYLRKLSDWIRLCVKCHKRYDIKRLKKLGWKYKVKASRPLKTN